MMSLCRTGMYCTVLYFEMRFLSKDPVLFG
jgi:hypothetical protein